jgi:hypothetical protein
MRLTKLGAAPVRQAKVPPCAPAGELDGGAASAAERECSTGASMRPTRR